MIKLEGPEDAVKHMNRLSLEDKTYIFIVDYLRQHTFIETIDKIEKKECLFSFPGLTNARGLKGKATPFQLNIQVPSLKDYAHSFNIVKKNIMAGNSYLVNLTCRVPVDTNLTLKEIFLRSHAPYRLWIKDTMVCFSPETFITIGNNVIRSFPMKGTISADIINAERLLMDSEKEAAEHATITDLIRNDLSMVAEKVNVEKYRYIEKISTHKGDILQTSSIIRGNLTMDIHGHAGDILFRQLPAGSITGAPKKKTMEIIREAEGYERGFYTGVMGYYSHGCMKSAVMIRFMDLENGQLYFKAGGGITAKSNMTDEYNEIIEKIYVPVCRNDQNYTR
jgi:para-aminobenzoate synthetase component 1